MADPDRLREQFAEAERLMREAEQAAARATGDVPPRGWQSPGDGRSSVFPDLGALTALIESLRGAIPPELARQLADALRELLLAIRAVLDWYIARLEPSEPREREVRDIPID
jgi:hypothetical protein